MFAAVHVAFVDCRLAFADSRPRPRYPTPDAIGQLPNGVYLITYGNYAVYLDQNGVVQPPGFSDPTNLTATAVANNKVHFPKQKNVN